MEASSSTAIARTGPVLTTARPNSVNVNNTNYGETPSDDNADSTKHKEKDRDKGKSKIASPPSSGDLSSSAAAHPDPKDDLKQSPASLDICVVCLDAQRSTVRDQRFSLPPFRI